MTAIARRIRSIVPIPRRSTVLLAAAFGTATMPAAPALAQASGDPLAGLDAYVAKAVGDWRVPGLSIAVVKGDSVVFEKGYGTRTLGRDEPVDAHTVFAVGSTTKAFTTAALAMLADSGRLAWDDPVRKHLPWFELRDPWVTRELTVRDAVTHRSGVAADDVLWLLGFSRGELLRRMRWLPQASSPRTRYAYNNLMFVVAGEAAASASGTTWEDLVSTRLLAPLGMTRTTPTLAAARALSNLATPHQRVADSILAIPYRDIDHVGPAGSMMSSAHDMARWLRFVLDSARIGGERRISPRQFEQIFSPQFVVPQASFYPAAARAGARFPSYGLGWFLHDYRGKTVAMHTGSIDGMSAIVGMIPSERVAVVVLANLDHAEVRHALMYRVFDLYLGGEGRDWSAELRSIYEGGQDGARAASARLDAARVANTRATLPLDAYAGVYADTLYGEMRVAREGAGLAVSIGPHMRGDLRHYHHDTFRVRWREPGATDNLLTFRLNARGRVGEAELSGLRPFRRVENPEAGERR